MTVFKVFYSKHLNHINALNERYNKVLINNHIQGIFNIEKTNKESSAELRRIVDAFSKHLRAIVQLAANQEWEKHSKKIKEPTIEEFRQFLIKRADFQKTMESKEMKSQEKLSDKFDKNNGSVPSGHTRGLFSANSMCSTLQKASECTGSSVALSAYSSRNYGLLSTALVRVVDANGKSFIVRAEILNGKEEYFIQDLSDRNVRIEGHLYREMGVCVLSEVPSNTTD
nr:unnamed protein product [Callosobruchus analis]